MGKALVVMLGSLSCSSVLLIFAVASRPTGAQIPPQAAPLSAPSPQRARPVTPNATLVSPEVTADGHVTFRLYAPNAKQVALHSEFDGMSPGAATPLVKSDDGVWSVTVGPIDPGVYRYTFDVDGLLAIDTRNPDVSESLNNVQSVFTVLAPDFLAMKPDVPHGSVETVWYESKSLGGMRRIHVYLPPGYETSKERYPVLYLLHGAGDNDDAWTSVGHANFIVDNLVAAGKAKAMIVVMPAGHVSRSFSGASIANQDPFANDFVNDLMPYVEKHYRVIADRPHRAIAGLSMGGLQTLNIALPHLDQFAYVGIFSSGWFNGSDVQFVKDHGAALDNASWKEGLKLLYVGVGTGDQLAYPTSQQMVAVLKAHGFNVEERQSDGGHTWVNWRNYLNEFAPQLFQ
jgi:enterochelin esterase-like enzyme